MFVLGLWYDYNRFIGIILVVLPNINKNSDYQVLNIGVKMSRKEVSNLLVSLGVSKHGYGDLKGLVPVQYENLTTGISIAIRLSDMVMNEISDEAPTHTYFHHYRTVNAFIDHCTLRVVMLLQSLGYHAVAVPASQSINVAGYDYSGVFQHRTAATHAGLGWIGKNACLITEEFGPRIRLGTILTNMPVEFDEAITESKCGDCDICIRKCPPIALVGNLWTGENPRDELVHAKVCSTHMSTHYKHIGRGVVCGICVKSCPKGKERIK